FFSTRCWLDAPNGGGESFVVGLQPVGCGKPLIGIWCRSVSRSALAGGSLASQKSSRSPTPAQSKRQAHSRGRSQLVGGSAGGQPRNVSASDSRIACQAGGGHPSNPSGRGRDDGVRGSRARCPRTIDPIKTLVPCCLS